MGSGTDPNQATQGHPVIPGDLPGPLAFPGQPAIQREADKTEKTGFSDLDKDLCGSSRQAENSRTPQASCDVDAPLQHVPVIGAARSSLPIGMGAVEAGTL